MLWRAKKEVMTDIMASRKNDYSRPLADNFQAAFFSMRNMS
jgi:hypothetical protein